MLVFWVLPLAFLDITHCLSVVLPFALFESYALCFFSFFAVRVLNACLTKCFLDLALSCLPSETRPGMGR